jgi:predicted metal-dependent HD superfamily phosphohydrolase
MGRIMIERWPSLWTQAWRDLRLPTPAPEVLAELLRRWTEPHRRYHTLQHLSECLAVFECDRALSEHPGEVAIAVWFHDVVYDSGRHDNEAASADLARRVLLKAGGDAAVAERVHAAIMTTRHSAMPTTPDERLLVDIDLAILGAEPARFAEYEAQIRDEYGFVPDAVFRSKRAEILSAFLARPVLFSTPALAQRFDAPARANLSRAIATLA